MTARFHLLLAVVVVVVTACGASDEERWLAHLLENPMASVTLPFAEPVARVEFKGDFDPWIGIAERALVMTRWEFEDEDQLLEALDILVEQAEDAGFELEARHDHQSFGGSWTYVGTSDSVSLRISGSVPPITSISPNPRPAQVSVSLQ